MNSLVFSNFLHRPARTVVSIFGIALGVLLIIFTIGIANGSMRNRANRESNVNAEIFFCPAGEICVMGNSPFKLPLSLEKEIENIEGVKDAVAIGQKTVEAKNSNRGERLIDGIDFDQYVAVVGLSIIDGRKFTKGADEVIVDTGFQIQKNLKIGDKMKIWDRDFELVGTYEPAAGARAKIPLDILQTQTGGEEKATAFLIKLDDGVSVESVAERISIALPESQLILTRDIEELYLTAIPALGVFLNVIIGVAAAISALVILLTMYTSVTERTRQIGIMKSLGMPNAAIAWLITKEALLISIFGVIVGVMLTYLLRFVLSNLTTLKVEISWTVIAIITVVGLIGGAIGALYPALRATRFDAVDALSYE